MSNASTVFDALCTLDTTINPFDDSCTLSDFGFGRAIRIDHHIYDKLTDTWVKKRSASQPFIEINAKVSHDDHVALGFELKNKRSLSATCTIPALAETGCQSCLAGVGIIHRLGLREADLMPVTMKMHSATQAGIRIIGATILRLSATTATGSQMETRQMVYITDATDKLFLNREACLALGLINDSFPSVGEHTTNAAMEETHQQVQQHSCNCPKRQLPPAPPTKLPFPATAVYLPRLKDFLLDKYASSTFNTCEHQPLPLMETPPMKLIVDPSAEPIAHHTPIPVPIHWREAVKAGLDQDVRLGVLEPVPVGEPVTWCHRMVVCAKKNGTPKDS